LAESDARNRILRSLSSNNAETCGALDLAENWLCFLRILFYAVVIFDICRLRHGTEVGTVEGASELKSCDSRAYCTSIRLARRSATRNSSSKGLLAEKFVLTS